MRDLRLTGGTVLLSSDGLVKTDVFVRDRLIAPTSNGGSITGRAITGR